ncbi:MAG: winged helix-turn-helix transcriptional regulator [Burkholderiaceae bacterium]|nr:winged helix-turn-helix transcriptional regulator [Burkholderiaceae bacterium]
MPAAETPARKTTRPSPAPACAPARRGAAPAAIDANELALLMKALAHPARVEILRYLSSRGNCYFGNLSDVVGLAPSTTSQHVSILKEAGLIEGSPEDQRTCYCVNTERLAVLKRLVGSL